MTNKELIAGILVGLAIVVVIGAILFCTFGLGSIAAHENNHKVQHMTEYCVSHGYDGFNEDSSAKNSDFIGCTNK